MLIPNEQVQQRIVDQVPAPQCLERTIEVARLVPQERVRWIDEQSLEVLIPQISEDSEQIVDVLVPQIEEALQFQVRSISHELQDKFFDVESCKKDFFD